MGRAYGEQLERVGYRLKEVAAMLGVCVRTVKRWVQAKKLPQPVVIGAEQYILASDWEEYMERIRGTR